MAILALARRRLHDGCRRERARRRARSEPNVPFANGDCHIHVSQVTALVESDEPVLEVGLPKIGPVQEAIGKYVAELIPNGATLQIGYGGIPDAVVMQLTDKHDLGIHTEMVGDGIMTLVEAGVVTEPQEELPPRQDAGDLRARLEEALPVHAPQPGAGNAPGQFHQRPLPRRTERQPARHQRDDADRPARPVRFRKPGLQALLRHRRPGRLRARRQPLERRQGLHRAALDRQDDTITRIVPTLSAGTHVTTSKNDINYVVTEHGVAQLRGKSAKQRAEALIGIAHPDFRGELREAAKKMNLL